MARKAAQLLCFSYHKTGTSLLLHVMSRVCARLGLTLENRYGLIDKPDPLADIILLPHSLLYAPPDWPYKAIRMIRDPRDIWVSGYLYHRRCEELWCTNADLDATEPTEWPRVDYSIRHWPQGAKQQYLEWLGRQSYQKNLLDRDQDEGLDFELEGYTNWTLEAMRAWPRTRVDALDVPLEAAMADFDGWMARIFKHFGFTPEEQQLAIDAARHEDIRRMNDAELSQRPQISSRSISKWRSFLTHGQIVRFEARHWDLISALGYTVQTGIGPGDGRGELSSPFQVMADGAPIPCVSSSPDAIQFALPARCERVVLGSGRVNDRDQPSGKRSFRGGIAIRGMSIQLKDGTLDFPADDPRFVCGWHAPQRENDMLYRWAAREAELPCAGLDEPVLVTIRATSFPAYLQFR